MESLIFHLSTAVQKSRFAMHRFFVIALLIFFAYGCASAPNLNAPPVAFQPVVALNNPVLIPGNHPEHVWEQIADVVDDYFRINEETPVRQMVGSEGLMVTYPEVGATLLEPWRYDSTNLDERTECTLQTMRRQAVVHVKAVDNGYAVEVAVYKQLEDKAQPEQAIAGKATLRTESTQVGVIDPITDEPMELGWIPQGRDVALEQRLLKEITVRLGVLQTRCATLPTPANVDSRLK